MPSTEPPPKFICRPHPHLYEINTWAWLEELSAARGERVTLGSVPEEEWDTLAGLGFDFIWLMGVWKRSPAGRAIARTEPTLHQRYHQALPGWTSADVVGSPYAVHAYRPDARIGAWAELDAAREKLRARGMGLFLDFVPNHTARDHPWTRAHPEYYVCGTAEDFQRDPQAFFPVESRDGQTHYLACGRDPYFPAWTDTAQLNYFHPGARAALLAELTRLAQHCDGLRCDMAMLVLNEVFARTWANQLQDAQPPPEEFWSEAVRALPGMLWLAEVYWDYEPHLHQLGFQFAYDKRLYDLLCGDSPQQVRAHLQNTQPTAQAWARFLENHDEPRSLPTFGRERLPGVASLLATLPGLRFYHQGQLEGRTIHLPVQLARAVAEPVEPTVRELYDKLLRVSDQELFHAGDWGLLEVERVGDDPTFENLIAYRWRKETALAVVAVNLGGSSAQGHVRLGSDIDAANNYNFFDQLNEQNYRRKGEDLARYGLYVRLDPFQAHLFTVAPS